MFELWIENNKYSLFDDLIVFSTCGIFVDVILIIHFIASWRKELLKTGWIIDYWHTNIFMKFFIGCNSKEFNSTISKARAVRQKMNGLQI